MTPETETPQRRTSLLGNAALSPDGMAAPDVPNPAILTEAGAAQPMRLSARTLQRLVEAGEREGNL